VPEPWLIPTQGGNEQGSDLTDEQDGLALEERRGRAYALGQRAIRGAGGAARRDEASSAAQRRVQSAKIA
jgi:hypothetical protein